MNKACLTLYFASIIAVFLTVGCRPKQSNTLIIDTKPAESFMDIMHYLKERSCNKHSHSLAMEFREDSILAAKLDSLFLQYPYEELEQNFVLDTDTGQIIGRQSLYEAMRRFPEDTLMMRGDLLQQYAEWWTKDNIEFAQALIADLKARPEQWENELMGVNIQLIPFTGDSLKRIEVVFCFDGYRGSAAMKNAIVIDLLDIVDQDRTAFRRLLGHEIHHSYYSDYLNNYNNPHRDSTFKEGLAWYNYSLVYEGVAQQINYVDYNSQVKQLYGHRDLIRELFDEWTASLRRINAAEDHRECYQQEVSASWDRRSERLHAYLKGEPLETTYARRPTVCYYISYHLYKCIRDRGGYDELKKVIIHPEQLLRTYNKWYDETMMVPKIPEDIVDLWLKNI